MLAFLQKHSKWFCCSSLFKNHWVFETQKIRLRGSIPRAQKLLPTLHSAKFSIVTLLVYTCSTSMEINWYWLCLLLFICIVISPFGIFNWRRRKWQEDYNWYQKKCIATSFLTLTQKGNFKRDLESQRIGQQNGDSIYLKELLWWLKKMLYFLSFRMPPLVFLARFCSLVRSQLTCHLICKISLCISSRINCCFLWAPTEPYFISSYHIVSHIPDCCMPTPNCELLFKRPIIEPTYV